MPVVEVAAHGVELVRGHGQIPALFDQAERGSVAYRGSDVGPFVLVPGQWRVVVVGEHSAGRGSVGSVAVYDVEVTAGQPAVGPADEREQRAVDPVEDV